MESCPNCKSTQTYIADRCGYVRCRQCGMTGPTAPIGNDEEAERLWDALPRHSSICLEMSREKGIVTWDPPLVLTKVQQEGLHLAAIRWSNPEKVDKVARDLAALVEQVEWAPNICEEDVCPWCRGDRRDDPAPDAQDFDDEGDYELALERWQMLGHKPDCPRQAALAAFHALFGEEDGEK